MQVFRFLNEHTSTKLDNRDIIAEPIQNGCVSVLSYLVLECGYEMEWNMLLAAVNVGHLRILLWLLNQGCPSDTVVCEMACLKDDLRMLTLLRERYKLPWDIATICQKCNTAELKAYIHRTKLPTERCACVINDGRCVIV